MKRKTTIIAIATLFILGLVYFGYSLRQRPALIDLYDTKAAGDVRVKQFHLWLAYFNGTDWNDAQKALLASNPDSLKGREAEVIAAFSPKDAKQIFGGVGSYDIRALRLVYHAESLEDKKTAMRVDRDSIWRQWMALYATEHQLTPEQIDAFYQTSQWIKVAKQHTKQAAEDFANATLVPVFGKEKTRDIFGAIGAYAGGDLCRREGHGPNDKASLLLANCDCSDGSYFNMCSGTCKPQSSGSCTRLPDSCGFLGYYACDSICGPGEEQ